MPEEEGLQMQAPSEQGEHSKINDANREAGSHEGHPGDTRRNKRMKYSSGLGSGRKSKTPNYSGSADWFQLVCSLC